MAKQQGGSDSNWEGMMKGWIPAHLDEPNHRGTHRPAAAHSDGTTPRPPPKWRGVAHKLYVTQKLSPPREDYDIEDRVYDISGSIYVGQHLLNPEAIEELLDELQAYAEDIDVFHVLDSDRAFSSVLTVLYNKHANVRAKAAEVITTMVQMYPTNQKLLVEGNGLHLLLYNLTQDPDATSRAKALGAISALLRNNELGITKFRLASGYARLRRSLSSDCVGVQRDALNLIEYLLHENSSDCNILTEFGFPCIMLHLASSDDALVRKAVLRILLLRAREEEGRNNGQLVKNDDSVKQILQKLIEGISAMALEDLGSARDEIQLVDSLWNACYDEPSSLAEKGLLVLPGEDALVPDVASKLFEPPLRVVAAAEAADGNSSLGEKCLLVLPGEDAPAPDVTSKLFELAVAEAADGNYQ